LSVSARRLQTLNNPQNADVYRAIKWLRGDGKGRFKDQVFEPPALHLGVKDRAFAGIAENSFRPADLLVSCI
jgi:hypothetical protein